jgi:hypothetical protein
MLKSPHTADVLESDVSTGGISVCFTLTLTQLADPQWHSAVMCSVLLTA